MQSIETALLEEHQSISHRASRFREEESLLEEDTDLEEEFNRAWGYLPPLDEEVAAILDKVIADPNMAMRLRRENPESKKFPSGLELRNVLLTETSIPNPCAHLAEIGTIESKEVQRVHDQLWTLDQSKCDPNSNEALFKQTLMMSFIARHHPIYSICLDFSVEESWICPPMPTRAYVRKENFLTQPKPDLAICFRREALFSDAQWGAMPSATRRLVHYEKDETKLFHFFTIEAKNGQLSPDNNTGKLQNHNNASQALHNIYEFCKDAGQDHEDIFFTNVRFFSVVANIGGLVVRIHRASKISDPDGFVTQNYPLRFEYQEFARISKGHGFDRRTVLDVLGKILIAYGVEKLQQYLKNAVESLVQKLKNDDSMTLQRQDDGFYRYGQTTFVPESRNSMSALIRTSSLTRFSDDILRSGSATPTQNKSLQRSGPVRKRRRDSDDLPAQNLRSRNWISTSSTFSQ